MLGPQAYPQQATWWTQGVPDGYGKRSFSAPTLLNIRWQQELKLTLNKDGEEVNQVGVIWLQQAISVGDYLALGDYTYDGPDGAVDDPTTLDSAYIVFDYQEMLSVMGFDANRKALMRA